MCVKGSVCVRESVCVRDEVHVVCKQALLVCTLQMFVKAVSQWT